MTGEEKIEERNETGEMIKWRRDGVASNMMLLVISMGMSCKSLDEI